MLLPRHVGNQFHVLFL